MSKNKVNYDLSLTFRKQCKWRDDLHYDLIVKSPAPEKQYKYSSKTEIVKKFSFLISQENFTIKNHFD